MDGVSQGCSKGTVEALLTAAADRYDRGVKELCALDAVAGDGDLGLTLRDGFRAAAQSFAEGPEDDIGAGLRAAALAFNRVAPSTLGTLITGALLEAGRVSAGAATLEPAAVADMLRAAVDAIARRGKAERGDKTILDALGPAGDAFASAVEGGATLAEGAKAAWSAASAGAEATGGLEPRAGRARWMAERSAGHPDGGAVAAAWFFEVWAAAAAG